tara:strand:+ start:632 stop:961 length:330 start_codon:yes stop_codon:yes gene_type:complete
MKIKSVRKLQARVRGWILRLDKFLCERAIEVIQKSAKSYLKCNQRTIAAITIQKVFRTYNIKIEISPKKIREYMLNYQQVCQKNKHLSNIIMKLLSQLSIQQENVSFSS